MAETPTKSLPEESRIPIAVVGLNFGRHIVNSQLITGPGAPFFKLAALCDVDRDKVAALATPLGIKAFTDLDELIADPSIPAIALYTGPNGRASLLRKMIRAGKDVMTTKPFENDPEAARAVLAEAREVGRTIHLNSPGPVLPPDLAQIKQWQHDFRLGQPVACRADVWVQTYEKADGSWYDGPARCPVAPIFRLGIYPINDLVALFGEADRVQVLSSRLFTGRPTPDHAQLGIRFKSGALANIFASFCVGDGDYYRNSLTLNFEHGTVYRNTGPIRAEPLTEESELSLIIRKDGRRHQAAQATAHASGQYRWELFNQAIRKEPIPDFLPPTVVVDGLKIIRAMAEAEHHDGWAQVV